MTQLTQKTVRDFFKTRSHYIGNRHVCVSPAPSMNSHPTHLPRAIDDDSYEDLLSLWSDLESGLSILLGHPLEVPEFVQKVQQYSHWMQSLLEQDTDASLYLLFQLASTSTIGYSTSHALVCAALCHITAKELLLPPAEHTSLIHAAITMNIAMTALQNELALQKERPSAEQQATIAYHPERGRKLLEQLGATNTLWLDIVGAHHVVATTPLTPATLQQNPALRLACMLHTVDRYAALISPRQSRPGGSASDSAKAISTANDEMAHALVRVVGLTPPGTFVRLDTGEIAVVLRRRQNDTPPLVATVMDAQGAPVVPRLHLARSNAPRIKAGLARSAVSLDLNHHTMVRLGSFTNSRPTKRTP